MVCAAARDAGASVPPDRRAFVRTLLGVFAALLPFGYFAYIAAVAVHEVLGHGLAAVVVGGEFRRFHLQLDGLGAAWTEHAGHDDFVLAAGVVVTYVLGAALLIVAARFRARLPSLVSLALVIQGATLVEDAAPYGLWGSWYGRGPADFARIVVASESALLQGVLVMVFAAACVAGTLTWNWLLFRWMEDHLGPFTRGRAAAALAAVGLGTAAGWMLFDWDQLVPGAGATPQIVGVGLTWTVLVWLFCTRRSDVVRRSLSRQQLVVAGAVSWTLAVVTIVAIRSWLRFGVDV